MLCLSSHAAENWRPLFNGTNLNGFYIHLGGKKNGEDPNHLVQIHDGVIHMYKDAEQGSQQPAGYISTEQELSDYRLRFQYKWGEKRFGGRSTAKRDAGVIYHMFGNDSVWPNGVECQVQEGDVGDIFTVNTQVTTTADPATTNSFFNVVTNSAGKISTNKTSQPKFLESKNGGVPCIQGVSSNIRRVVRSEMLEHDGWNTVDVIVRGDSATHIINGKINNRADAMRKWVDGHWEPLTKGKIIFQLEFAEVLYRNIEISPLPKKALAPRRVLDDTTK